MLVRGRMGERKKLSKMGKELYSHMHISEGLTLSLVVVVVVSAVKYSTV